MKSYYGISKSSILKKNKIIRKTNHKIKFLSRYNPGQEMIPYTSNSGYTQNRFSWGTTTLGTVKSVSSPTNINAQFAIKIKLVNGEHSIKERKKCISIEHFYQFKKNKPQPQKRKNHRKNLLLVLCFLCSGYSTVFLYTVKRRKQLFKYMHYNALVLGFFPDSTDLWFVNSGRTIHLLDNVGSGTPVYNIVVGQRSQDILTKTMNDPSGKFTWNSDTGNVY